MHDGRFDPSGFYEFNLTGGMVRARTGERVVILSEDVLSSLVAAAARDGDLTPLRRLGELLGVQVLGSVLSPEAVLGHASAVTALFGWGRLAFERWGSALVIVLRDKPELDEDELGAAALLGGMFSEISQRQVSCVPTGDSKFIMVDFEVAETVWGWFKDGADLPAIVGMLDAKRAS
ncbi:MAG: hypothetical protein JRE19_02365 [Deltaproteobacteria bacterium]|nr:hypothetical protein [Deltaproteobacteria bacterium]